MSETATIASVLDEIGERLRTQDNRITEAPIFAVQQKRRIWGAEDADGYEWYHSDEWERVDSDEASKLERDFDIYGDVPKGYSRVGYVEIWEFVTACFTEQGCKDFLAINGHNLTEPRIYAYGSWRNQEWKAVRSALMERVLTPDTTEAG